MSVSRLMLLVQLAWQAPAALCPFVHSLQTPDPGADDSESPSSNLHPLYMGLHPAVVPPLKVFWTLEGEPCVCSDSLSAGDERGIYQYSDRIFQRTFLTNYEELLCLKPVPEYVWLRLRELGGHQELVNGTDFLSDALSIVGENEQRKRKKVVLQRRQLQGGGGKEWDGSLDDSYKHDASPWSNGAFFTVAYCEYSKGSEHYSVLDIGNLSHSGCGTEGTGRTGMGKQDERSKDSSELQGFGNSVDFNMNDSEASQQFYGCGHGFTHGDFIWSKVQNRKLNRKPALNFANIINYEIELDFKGYLEDYQK
ncbi:hypothetical protein MG293_007137 [Ovis ammon polii]|uniref:Uncharacterized protein n=1 Tax=Ovis ammon polii TaxID=230172 RepID=A0AAD4YE09_OVIAM|nr:hypothetical protein MG293_007137 [Ovis ammon polii]